MSSKYENLGIQKYWSFPSSYTKERRQLTLEKLIDSKEYIFSLKTDGVFSRAIFASETPMLQSRGISKVTKTYGRMEEKVLWFQQANQVFSKETVILGECFVPGGIDRDAGAITRSLPPRALKLQEKTPLHWRMFDCLCWEGKDLLNTPIEERIKYLKEAERKINHPLVEAVEYFPMDESFFDKINVIFQNNGEGVVLYKKGSIYQPDKRGPAWANIKIKQEITSDIDALVTSLEPPTRMYNGGDVSHWQYWQNTRTGELVQGSYFGEYQTGGSYEPVTKNFFFNLPGAIYTSVYDNNHNLVPLCKVAGLTDEFKEQLRDNFNEWYLCPVTLGGMMVSTAGASSSGVGISIRHPYIKSIRRDDISPDDCTLSKIIS